MFLILQPGIDHDKASGEFCRGKIRDYKLAEYDKEALAIPRTRDIQNPSQFVVWMNVILVVSILFSLVLVYGNVL